MNSTLALVAFHPRSLHPGLMGTESSAVDQTTSRHIRAADHVADPPPPRQLAREKAPNGMRRSVLICDDRPDVRHELSRALRSDSRDWIHEVPDGHALLDAYEEGADQVLIGVHSGTAVGMQAIELLLATHPDAAPIVFGSITDIDLLAAAYAVGAGGLLMFEPRSAGPPLD